MERSAIRERLGRPNALLDFAALHPGYNWAWFTIDEISWPAKRSFHCNPRGPSISRPRRKHRLAPARLSHDPSRVPIFNRCRHRSPRSPAHRHDSSADDADFSGRWRRFKSLFTRLVVARGVPCERDGRGEYALWQRRFWEHPVRDESDLVRHVDYIHYNPVKHDLVSQVSDWPHSSFHRYVRLAVLPADWAGADVQTNLHFGE